MALIPYYPTPPAASPPWLIAPAALAIADDPLPLLVLVARQLVSAEERAAFARLAMTEERAGRCRLEVLRPLTQWLVEAV
jgi:hypothetical protein